MKKNDHDLLYSLVDELAKSATDPGEIQVCPICQGKLHVSMHVLAEPDMKKKLGIGVHCENCGIEAFFHGGYIPPWAKEAPKPEFASLKDALEELDKGPEKKQNI